MNTNLRFLLDKDIGNNNTANNVKALNRRPQVCINRYPETQTVFKELPVVPGRKSYSDSVKNRSSNRDVFIFTDSIAKGIRMHEFNRYVTNGNAKLLSFPGASSHQLLHYIDVHLDEEIPKAVILHIGVNDVLNDHSQSNIDNFIKNISKMVDKCRSVGVTNIFVSVLVYTTKVSVPVLERIHESLVAHCENRNCVYIDNRNIHGMHLFKDGLHLMNSGKDILANNFIFNLNNNFHVNRDFLNVNDY